MKALTQANLITTLNAIRGATFATIVTETDARLKKTGNPFGPVRKVSRVNVTLGFQYAAAVNRQRDREGTEADFEAKPRQWGQRVIGSPMFVEHKGKTYLEVKVERSLSKPEYIDANGKTLAYEDISPFLPARKGPGRQGVDREVVVRDYSLDSIRSLTFKGETHVMLQEVAAPLPATTASQTV